MVYKVFLMKNLTDVSGEMFITAMQKPSCQRENCLLTTKAGGTERDGSTEEGTKGEGEASPETDVVLFHCESHTHYFLSPNSYVVGHSLDQCLPHF